MKRLHTIIFLLGYSTMLHAQNVGIGTTIPNSNAALEIKASNKGVLMPRLSNTSKLAMTNVPKGMMLYDSTYSAFYYHDGNNWRPFAQQNTDSMVNDYSSTPEVTQNMADFFSNVTTTARSGLLYDNGGPSANYSNNATDGYGIFSDDSTVGFKLIVEQFNVDNLDTLMVLVANDQEHPVQITGTGTYTLPGGYGIVFLFKSNASVNQAGFRIRWSKMIAVKDPAVPIPSFGWYFDPSRLAARAGVSFNNNWASDSLGKHSLGFGSNVYAKGNHSFSFGENTSASAIHSFAFGHTTKASGVFSIGMGEQATASGSHSFALGWQSEATNDASVAVGQMAKAGGLFSLAIGTESYAGENRSLAVGANARAESPGASAVGMNSLATYNYATAMG